MECKYCQNEFCANANCPLVGDYCPSEEICKYAEEEFVPCTAHHTHIEKRYLSEYDQGVIFGATGQKVEFKDVEYAECWATKERERCDCGGDRSKCNFYNLKEKD